jgi:hypothetical protein
VNVQDGKGGAPLMGGVAPGAAGLEMATVLWPVAPDQMDCKGIAVGLVEWKETDVIELAITVTTGLAGAKEKKKRQHPTSRRFSPRSPGTYVT